MPHLSEPPKKPTRSKTRKTAVATTQGKSPAKNLGARTKLSAAPDTYQHLADLKLWSPKNTLDGPAPLFARAVFKAINIDGDGRHYMMYIRWAHLNLRFNNFKLLPEPRPYTRMLSKEEAQAHAERVMHDESKTGWNATVGARFGFKGLSAGSEASKGRDKSDSHIVKINSHIELTLVQDLGGGQWRIGDEELGDIRKLQGFLEGPYLHDEPEARPLCHVETQGKGQGRQITASLSVSLNAASAVHVVREGDYASASAVPAGEREGSFTNAFKDRLRSLSLLKGVDGREFVIAKHVLVEETVQDDD